MEAQRLGLEAHASDLNPVAVLINKALIEIPPRFADQPPVHPHQEGAAELQSWSGAQGLAADVRYYGRWMREVAERRIGHLYPKVTLPPEGGGGEATVIAWLWARTVRCPNPACGAAMPLISSFWLSKKKGRQTWIEPVVDRENRTVSYKIVSSSGRGTPTDPPKVGRGAKFRCLCCGQLADDGHVKAEGVAGRMGRSLMAIVAEGDRKRVYLPPNTEQIDAAQVARPVDFPRGELPTNPRWFSPPAYGMSEWADLFTARQLTALTTFCGLVGEARERARADALAAGLSTDPTPLRDGGTGAVAYAEAVSVYLAFLVSKCTDYWANLCSWHNGGEKIRNTFARQAIPMVWDFAEANPFSSSSGSFDGAIEWVWKAIIGIPAVGRGRVVQTDAAAVDWSLPLLVSTDPPYYDNIGYADLSDFFYVWLRRCLGSVFPDVCSTLQVPKRRELVATPYRFDGDKRRAEEFFEVGLNQVFERLRDVQDERFPLSVYYAFKQAETTEGGVASSGWETMLQSLLDAGFVIGGTWPIRSELSNRMLASGTNALASSIVLVCRRRPASARLATRREFLGALRSELPEALRLLREGGIAPVDMAQAAIGPGMAVFSRYARVLEASGETMRVRTALELINETLDETTAGIDADFDYDTRWAVTWFGEYGFGEGDFGRAEQLSKARNTSVAGLAEAGIVAAGAGRVRLLRRDELDAAWDPTTDGRFTVWEVAHHLIGRLHEHGEENAAALLGTVGGHGESARELAYRLYQICERKGWAAEALDYNGLVTSWPELTKLAATGTPPTQTTLL